MTGYRSERFNHNCETDGCYHAQLPAWDDLIESFPPGVYPTDIDGMVELDGHVLFMEQKRAGGSLHGGQRMAFRYLGRLGGVTVVIFRTRAHDNDLDVLIFDDGTPQGFQRRTREWLCAWLAQWSANARSNPMTQGAAE